MTSVFWRLYAENPRQFVSRYQDIGEQFKFKDCKISKKT